MAKKPEWKGVQDKFVRDILGRMGRLRMHDKDMCRKARVSASYWSELKHLKKQMSVKMMLKISKVFGLSLSVQCPSTFLDGAGRQSR